MNLNLDFIIYSVNGTPVLNEDNEPAKAVSIVRNMILNNTKSDNPIKDYDLAKSLDEGKTDFDLSDIERMETMFNSFEYQTVVKAPILRAFKEAKEDKKG